MLVKVSHNHVLQACYKKYCNILMKVIKEAKKLYYYELINKLENKIWTMWKIIKKETSNMDNISQMRVQDKQINNPKEIVDAFHKYFLSAAGKLLMYNLKRKEAVELLHESKNDDILDMKLIPTTETEIKRNQTIQIEKTLQESQVES